MRKRIEILLLIILCITVTACGEADTITKVEVNNEEVIITEAEAGSEGESYNLDDGAISYVSEVAEGQPFVLIDNKWIDMSSDNIKSLLGIDFRPGNACIKALYK